MRNIPIVFCFDDNLLLAAGVCINSLLLHAHEDTFYHIFIIHDSGCKFPHTGYLNQLTKTYPNCAIEYRCVGTEFKDAFQIRGITQATYYRLLIPELVTDFDKLMYHDVDVLFRSDLANLFDATEMTDYYLAGVVAPAFMDADMYNHIKQIGLDPATYVLAGNIIINAKKMREDGMVDQFRKMVQSSTYKYQDMDIFNLSCRNHIKRLPPLFCGTIEIFKLIAYDIDTNIYTKEELKQLDLNGIIHYNGPKPWEEWCPNLDIWWEYYRKSPYYNPHYYYDFYMNKRNEPENMPLKSRVKLLLKFFYRRSQ
jgi:lipopolysaccharide biosynthesis glycosyltransferase